MIKFVIIDKTHILIVICKYVRTHMYQKSAKQILFIADRP